MSEIGTEDIAEGVTSITTSPPPPIKPSNKGANVFILEPVKADEVAKRGRPKTKVSPSDVYTSRPEKKVETVPPKSVKDKKREVMEVKSKILEEVNDTIIELVSTLGVNEGFLYKGGRAPIPTSNSKYTELGNALCIQELQATAIAHGYVELREIPAIKKLVGEGGKEGPSYFWIVLGGLGIVSYGQQLMKAVNELKNISTLINQKSAESEIPDENVVRRSFTDE